MKRTPVSSSNLASVGYEVSTSILEIEFHGGSVYQYYNVPERVYYELLGAVSKGKYFHRHIRDRYSYRRVR